MRRLIIRGGTVVLESELLENGAVLVEEGRIAAVGPADQVAPVPDAEVVDATGLWVSPGFIDVHVHGGGGDRLGSDGEANQRVARTLARFGTTSFLAGIGSRSSEDTLRSVETVAQGIAEGTGGAEIVGVHLEGPFLNVKRKGGMDAHALRSPSLAELKDLIAASGDRIRLVAIAPELPGALEVIAYMREHGIVSSIAHSAASYEEACAGIKAGISHATHTYNAMTGLHHRDPGVVGAVLTDDSVSCELIGDLAHVAPAPALVMLRCKGRDRVVLVSDGVFAGGLPDGEYDHGDGRNVTVKDGTCTLPDGTLAGSVSTMSRNIANLVQRLGVDLVSAVRMASLNPAREIGLEGRKGSLAPGKDADLTLFDSDFQVQRTLVRGKEVFRAAR